MSPQLFWTIAGLVLTIVSKTIAGGKFGGGGGGSGTSGFGGGPGGGGVVRIIDAAGGRAFPSTNVGCANDFWYR